MKIAIASDHRGFAAKEKIFALLGESGHDISDAGVHSTDSCDYPDVAWPAAMAVSNGDADRAILICGSGLGMSICANKVKGIRATLCHDELSADMSRRHNNANVLCLAGDVIGEQLLLKIVTRWLDTDFEAGGRHERRIKKIAMVEEGKDPAGLS